MLASFVYDGDGVRVKKTEGGQTTLYVNRYFEKNLASGNITTYYYLGDELVAKMTNGDSNTRQFVHHDHLTGTSVVSDKDGVLVSSILYAPFGTARSGDVPIDIKFTGQRLDGTGMYYYGARYYDPTIGRFTSPDKLMLSPSNPQGLNRYTYVFNNPLRYNDPSGNWPPALDRLLGRIGDAFGRAASAVSHGMQVAATAQGDRELADLQANNANMNSMISSGASIIVACAEIEAEHTGIVTFVPTPTASANAASVASQLPAQNLIEVPSNSVTGWAVDTFLHSVVTLNGTVVTTKDITQPSSPGGYDPLIALHEEEHVVQQAQDQNFFYDYFFSGGNNYNDPSSYEGQAKSFAAQYDQMILPIITYDPDPSAWWQDPWTYWIY